RGRPDPPGEDRRDVLLLEGRDRRARRPRRRAGRLRGELRRVPRGAGQGPRPAQVPHELRPERAQAHARGRAPRGDHGDGARGESLENYIKRLAALEELAAQKKGVERVYALQAGREIRVIVKPTEIDDDGAVLLSHEIAREIEAELEYPGQVKVTVIRESRAVEFAK